MPQPSWWWRWIRLPAESLPWPLSLALVLVGAWGCAELVLGVWKGPLKHAVHGALHLVAHPRPERFHDGLGRDTALRPLDLETNGKLGAERPVDFDWNRLLGFDACVQCGRCETACPAYAAGLPLNPKKLIQDLVRPWTKAPTTAPTPATAIPAARSASPTAAPSSPSSARWSTRIPSGPAPPAAPACRNAR